MESLGLDLKILVAQVVNFGILFFILKKLLYKPMIKALDARNKKISDSVKNSEKIEERLKKIEEKESELMATAREKAKAEKSAIIELGIKEKEKILSDAKASAEKVADKALQRLQEKEKEMINSISDEYIEKITDRLYKKISVSGEKGKFPVLKSLIKNA